MTLELMEGAVDDVKTYLENNIASKLDELDAEYGDSITLDDIKSWYVNEVRAVPEYPSVFLLGDTTDVLGEGGGWMKSSQNIVITILVGHQELDGLRRRVYRYVRAFIELLVEARTSVGWSYIINFNRVTFTPTFTESGSYLADASLDIGFAVTESHSIT